MAGRRAPSEPAAKRSTIRDCQPPEIPYLAQPAHGSRLSATSRATYARRVEEEGYVLLDARLRSASTLDGCSLT